MEPQSTGLAPPIAQVAGAAATQAALAEVTAEWERVRRTGRLVLELTPDQIDDAHLVRDRLALDPDEQAALVASIRAHGQRTPVEVAEPGPDADGRYGLIAGWRRVQALRQLAAEGDARPVLALLRRPDDAAAAYVAMVEENEIRHGLSYYERARIAARATDLGVFADERTALQQLFATASRARRSKIGSFVTLYRELDPVLRFPAAIPERLGLALVKALAAGRGGAIRTALTAADATDAPTELAALQAVLRPKSGPKPRLEPHSTPKLQADPKPQEIRPGIFLTAAGHPPALTLSGPGVDAGFHERLIDWLAGTGQGASTMADD